MKTLIIEIPFQDDCPIDKIGPGTLHNTIIEGLVEKHPIFKDRVKSMIYWKKEEPEPTNPLDCFRFSDEKNA